MVSNFIEKGASVSFALTACNLSKSSYYYHPKEGKRGRKPSLVVQHFDGSFVDLPFVLDCIKRLLNQEFVDYGYSKVTTWLRRYEHLIINKKRVYKLMKEHNLLAQRIRRNKKGKLWGTGIWRSLDCPFTYLQTDIKYIYIHGEHRNALLVSIIDCYSKAILSYKLAWSVRKQTVINLVQEMLSRYQFPKEIILRSDNGSQYEAGLFREYLSEMNIQHEFTHIASPQENCYIESFHSIVERTICRVYDFETIEEAKEVFHRFMNFYNLERLHGGIGNKSPQELLKEIDTKKTLKLFQIEN